MKKFILIVLLIFTILIGLLIIWFNLPIEIIRSSDISLGNEISKKIEEYKRGHGLPEESNWVTLRKFGLRDEFSQPSYSKLDSANFELIYYEGFDGPYLMWNSKERIWKMDHPTPPRKNIDEYIIKEN